jgi:hypothetical protein
VVDARKERPIHRVLQLRAQLRHVLRRRRAQIPREQDYTANAATKQRKKVRGRLYVIEPSADQLCRGAVKIGWLWA